LQVTHAAFVHPADDDGGSRPQVVTSAKDELKGLGERRHDHVEALISVLRAVDRSEPTLFCIRRREASEVDMLRFDGHLERPLCEEYIANSGGDGRRSRQPTARAATAAPTQTP